MGEGLDINIGCRPCIVTHKVRGKKVEKQAIFHKWVTSVVKEDDLFVVQDLALVEYKDGTLAQVKIKSLRFIDNLVADFFDILEANYEEDSEEQISM